MLDAALIAEQYGRRLAPAPLIEVSVAARLLERCGPGPADGQLASVLEGDQLVTMALLPARSGVVAMVPWAAVADSVIVLVDDHLLLLRAAQTAARPGLGAEAPADVVIGDAASALELASGRRAVDLAGGARDDWRTLKSAALVGLAAEAVSLGIGYATQRQQFGRLIGSFQALAHGLVDVATAVDGARLLAYEAAWAIDHDRLRAEHLASMSMAFAADTAANGIGPGAALPRRLRLHRGVRRSALLSPGPVLVSDRGDGARRTVASGVGPLAGPRGPHHR